jgi:uncharacterized protein (DUF1501 family)
MTPSEPQREMTRRGFLTSSASGLGLLALSSLLREEGLLAAPGEEAFNPMALRAPHFAPRAKNCIFVFLFGGPSQMDLFDPKPLLNQMDGEPLPESLTKNVRFAFLEKETARLMGSPRTFSRFGQSGLEFSDLLPHLSTCADDIAMIRSMHTEAFNHSPGELVMSTGVPLHGHPSIGSWLTYGLGSPSRNLPGFVVLTAGGSPPQNKVQNWSSGFLPPSHQGVIFRNQGEPIIHLNNPGGVNAAVQRSQLDAVRALNQRQFRQVQDPEIAARIAAYELAFRMQSAAPELIDLAGESSATLETYGVNRTETAEQLEHQRRCGGQGVMRSFATNCLLARRMVERGVRFVNLFHGTWDQHDKLDPELAFNCAIVDQPIAALLKDLKQRGLLEETLVVWASEFGRTPLGENRKGWDKVTGRDHHPFAFTLWMAGGGVKGGTVVGKTDDFGWHIVEDAVHINDFHATILHLFGLDHTRLTYRFKGRDFRLTDVAGKVVHQLIG